MIVLALDLGSKTGWATNAHRRLESGVQTFDVRRGESPGMRYVRFSRWIGDLTADTCPNVVAYEQPFVMRSGQAAEVALGFCTRVQEACARLSINHMPVNGSTLKKWTTGSGKAKKPDMIAAVNRRWRESREVITDDNEADAIAILHWALEELKGA